MSTYLVDNGILSDQFRFSKGCSTDDQLQMMYGDVAAKVDDGIVVNVALMDYSKTFDMISHNILLQKVRTLGLEDALFDWIWMFLMD